MGAKIYNPDGTKYSEKMEKNEHDFFGWAFIPTLQCSSLAWR